jgi:hypothetical protein
MVFCILTALQEYLHAAWTRHDGVAAHGAVRSSGSDLTDGVSAVACQSVRVRAIGACFQKEAGFEANKSALSEFKQFSPNSS